MAENCALMLNDPPDTGGGVIPNYSTERCTVDRQDNPTIVACGWVNAGLRVFDIRDPLHPKEIAYWKGPATRTAFLPGSGAWAQGIDLTVDRLAGYVHIFRHGRDLEIWTVSDNNGLQILRFSDHFKAVYRDVFDAVHPEGTDE